MNKFLKLAQAEVAKAEELLAIENPSEDILAQIDSHMAKAEKYRQLAKSFDAAEPADVEPAAAMPRKVSTAASIQVAEPNWMKDPKKGFSRQRDFFQAVIDNTRSLRDDRMRHLATVGSDEQNAQNNEFGGFLIPEAFLPEVMMTRAEGDPSAGLTRMIPMQSNSIKIPARVDKDHSSSVAGGITVSRRNEMGQIQSSRMKFHQVKLEANSLDGLAYATNELLTDSPVSLTALLEEGFAEAYAGKMIDEKLNGSGAGEYLGALNSPAFISVAKESAQTADTINYTNILKMRSRIWGYQDAIWMANQDIIPQLGTLGNDEGGKLIYMPSIREDIPELLLGRPIVFTEYLPTLGDANDIVLINWREYLEGEYQPVVGASSMHVRFEYNEMAFRFTSRNDGRPWWLTALTPKKGQTRSPFVGLAERS